jgi:hypothetical protein
MTALQSLISLLGLFADLIIFIVCISYLSRTQTTDSMLLCFGSLVRVLIRIFYVAIPHFASVYDSGADGVIKIYTLANALSLVGSILFCIGFVILIRRMLFLQPRSQR